MAHLNVSTERSLSSGGKLEIMVSGSCSVRTLWRSFVAGRKGSIVVAVAGDLVVLALRGAESGTPGVQSEKADLLRHARIESHPSCESERGLRTLKYCK